jgi:conjugal transfer/entry exclusion protein
VRDGVLKTLEVAAKTDVKITGPSDGELATRMAELDKKIAATSDAEALEQYTAARSALDDQRRYRDHFSRGKERLVAKMHNHVAALEKFQLAATALPATTALAAEAPSVKQLAELSQDVTASGDALAEVELGDKSAN